MSDTTKVPEENKELNQTKPTVEEEKQLNDQELNEVTGGGCVNGAHIKQVIIE